jgi:hypothetical protein
MSYLMASINGKAVLVNINTELILAVPLAVQIPPSWSDQCMAFRTLIWKCVSFMPTFLKFLARRVLLCSAEYIVAACRWGIVSCKLMSP